MGRLLYTFHAIEYYLIVQVNLTISSIASMNFYNGSLLVRVMQTVFNMSFGFNRPIS